MTPIRSAKQTPVLLALCSFFLLCAVAVALQSQQLQTLQRMYQEAAIVRSHTLASDTSQKIAHALSLGIPLQELVGVDALLHALQQQHPDLVSMEVQDAQARPLWTSTSTKHDGAVYASSIIQGPDNSASAIVIAHVNPQQAGQLLAQNLWIWLGLLALLTTLSFWAARLCFSLRPWLREDVIDKISKDVEQGIFQSAWLSSHSVTHDPRPEQLSAGMRSVHEAQGRLRRLVHSLRQTEPSPHHRQQLDAILQQATHKLTLDASMERRRIHAIEQQCFWLSLLLLLATTSPWIWQVMVTHDRATQLLSAATLYLSAMLVMCWLGRYIRLPVMQILITSFVILLLTPFVVPHSSTGAAVQATVSGLLTGFCYRAFQAVIHTARHKFIFARPRLSHPIERAYVYVLACLGPLLASLTELALSGNFARIALLLPAACGLMTCLLWNASISPWRTRIRPISRSTPGKSSWITGCFYAAIGLGISTLRTETGPFSVQLACMLIAGWLTGCCVFTHAHRYVLWGVSSLLVSLSVWCLISPSDLAVAVMGYAMALVVATSPARLRARSMLSAIGIGAGTGMCISYFSSSAITLSLGSILLACSCLLSCKLSRQGVARAD